MNSIILPKISIITVCRNAAATIERAIQSVVNQNYTNLEFIIIDGGSTDGTADIIKRYQNKIAYWHSRPDRGPAEAHNLGFEQATGNLIGFLMADDWLEPELFTSLAVAYHNNPYCDIFTCQGQVVSLNQNGKYQLVRQYVRSSELTLSLATICAGIPLICLRFFNAKLVKRTGLFKAFGDDGKNYISCDTDWLIRCLRFKPTQTIIPQLGMTYFAHNDSMTFGNNINTLKKIHRESMQIALQHKKDIVFSAKQREILMNWYCDHACRLFARELLGGNVIDACKTLISGLKTDFLGFFTSFSQLARRMVAQKLKIGSLYETHRPENISVD